MYTLWSTYVGRKFVLKLKLGPLFRKNASKNTILVNKSDFIWDFGKLPFPLHLGNYAQRIWGDGGIPGKKVKWPNKIAE